MYSFFFLVSFFFISPDICGGKIGFWYSFIKLKINGANLFYRHPIPYLPFPHLLISLLYGSLFVVNKDVQKHVCLKINEKLSRNNLGAGMMDIAE